MDVVEINRPGATCPRNTEPPARPPVRHEHRLRSPHGDVDVVGRGLNVEMGVNARVTGTIGRPILSGTARSSAATMISRASGSCSTTRGSVTLSTHPDLIRLNLSATRDDPALTATIRVTGTAVRPRSN
jgi:translocation and assembly module TamB